MDASMESRVRADFGARLVGFLVDTLLVVGAIYLLSLAAGEDLLAFPPPESENVRGPIVLWEFLMVAVVILYYAILDGRGQTVGKRLMRIRVVQFDGDGSPIGFRRGLLRSVGRLPSSLLFFLGYLWALWDPYSQTWHDKIANTSVVRSDSR